MAATDFDWYGTCAAIHGEGVTEAVLAADTTGNVFSSFPLAEDGNYTFWIFSDPYKATVTKEDGTEVEEDIYEAYNFGLLASGTKDQIPPGQGVRIGGEKFMWLREVKNETYPAKIKDADGNVSTHNVTLDSLHVLQKGQTTIFVAVKGGYVFAGKASKSKPEQSAAAVTAALAIGFYWAVGPDAA